VFDAGRKCLLGIRKISVRANSADAASEEKDIAKYFVPASTMRHAGKRQRGRVRSDAGYVGKLSGCRTDWACKTPFAQFEQKFLANTVA
jgi:hypothetical protein